MRHLCDSGPFSSRLGGDSSLEIAKAWLLLGLPCRGSAKGGTMPGSQQSETVLGGGGTGEAAEGAVEIRLIGVAQFVRDVDEPDMRIT
jgi:hypothetical protein